MERQVNDGVINHLDAKNVVVFQKLDGLYMRFYKKGKKILIGLLNPIAKPNELVICNEVMNRYCIDKTLKQGEILYGVIYGGGVSKKSNIPYPIANFYNLSKKDRHISWPDFETLCFDRALAFLSIVYSGEWGGERASQYLDKQYLVRPFEEALFQKYDDLCRRIHWYPKY